VKKKFLWVVLPLGLLSPLVFAASETPVTELSDVDVIETAPLSGLELRKDQIPSNVQTATDKEIAKTNAVNITDFMNRTLGSVYINDIQGNGFQPDVNYRGYTASPLLGTPQGLSVYMDGVRLNQPFGDVVSWDLIPKSAIANMSMMSGSNPLFGRNTLGGALVLKTKDGKHNAGNSVQSIMGNYGRYGFEFEHGGSDKATNLDWFVTGNFFKDQGWRDHSPTEVRQIFGKVGWEGERSEVKLTTAYADNGLYGNGLQEQRFLANDYSSVYTSPDITDNRSLFMNLEGSYHLSDSLTLSGNSYYRNIRTKTFNGDVNEGSLNQSTYALSAAETTLLKQAGIAVPNYTITNLNTPFPSLKCQGQALSAVGNVMGGEPGEKCNGLINQTKTSQENWGTAGQMVWDSKLWNNDNHFLFGGAYDESVANFNQTTQIGYLNPDRSVTGLPYYADGVTGGNVNLVPFDNRVSLNGNTRTFSFFTEDTLSIGDYLHITAAGRYNYTSVNNKDRINPLGGADSLNGKDNYDRFNPAIGMTYTPMKEFNVYAGYNEGSRAPTAIELGCADPNNPCKLPNAMAGDPPLKQVVTRTWEAGFRGQAPWQIDWHVGYFHAENKNDIMFVADNQAGFGYFKNFGKTQRQGLEVSLDRKVDDLSIGANYTYLDATYQSNEIVNGTANSTATLTNNLGDLSGTINIKPGNKIPLIPAHSFKTYLDYQFTPEWGANVNVMGFSSMYARGNENNAHQPDGVKYLGSGQSAGYVITNLGVRYHPSYVKGLQIFGQVNNLFDKQYETAAQLGPTGFDNNGNYIARPLGGSTATGFPIQQATFYAPGAPRLFWFGLRYSF
jgi:outer membrane receptor protein involved in Fe transport